MATVTNTSIAPFVHRKFQYQPASQQRSPLLRLPAELRVKILRILMKSSDMIYTKRHREDELDENDFETPDPYLSAQLLRCCQSFYEEGVQILYGENVLQMVITVDGYWNSCEALGGQIHLPHCFECIDTETQEDALTTRSSDQAVLNEIISSMTPGIQLAYVKDAGIWSCFKALLPAISNFQNLHITMVEDMGRYMSRYFYVIYRLLLRFVQDKHVTLKEPTMGEYFNNSPDLWKCASLQVECKAEKSSMKPGSKQMKHSTDLQDPLPLLEAMFALKRERPVQLALSESVRIDELFQDFETAVADHKLDKAIETAITIVNDLKVDEEVERARIDSSCEVWKAKMGDTQREYDAAMRPIAQAEEPLNAAKWWFERERQRKREFEQVIVPSLSFYHKLETELPRLLGKVQIMANSTIETIHD